MNFEGILSNKQHLNLSNFAYDIVQSDMYAFQKTSLSGFLNEIFQNYYEQAEASISRTLKESRRKLEEQLTPVQNLEQKEQVLDSLVSTEREKLLRKVLSYPKGKGFKFYLNTENVELLMDEFEPESEWYQGHPMKYFKAVIEEYAEKSRSQREAIVFAPRIHEIQLCIEMGSLITIESSDRRFEVKPYSITCDHDSLYHYLVGISRPAGGSAEDDRIASFRISKINKQKARSKNYRSGRITSRERDMIEERIQAVGVQFLISEQEDVVVRLTEKGMRRFSTQPHLRPKLEYSEGTDTGTICHFTCTEYQVRAYFMQFGPDVEILKPESIREQFKDWLNQAAQLYQE